MINLVTEVLIPLLSLSVFCYWLYSSISYILSYIFDRWDIAKSENTGRAMFKQKIAIKIRCPKNFKGCIVVEDIENMAATMRTYAVPGADMIIHVGQGDLIYFEEEKKLIKKKNNRSVE